VPGHLKERRGEREREREREREICRCLVTIAGHYPKFMSYTVYKIYL